MTRYSLLLSAFLFACSSGSDLATDPNATPQAPAPDGGGSAQTTATHAPVANADTFHVARGETLVITTLLANDTDEDGDALVAYPDGTTLFYNDETGHVEYTGSIGMWEDNRPDHGHAFAWNTSGGFSFSAFPDATPGVVEFTYQVHEDTPGALVSAPAKVVILVE